MPPLLPRSKAVRRQVVVMGLAVGAFGLSFGVLAVGAGLSAAQACAMSLLVFGGGAQFAAVGVVGFGGAPGAAVASGLLLNARYLAFGLALAERLRRRWVRFSGLRGAPVRALAGHLVIDESCALAFAQEDDEEAEAAFWAAGAVVFVLWNAGTLAGALLGNAVDPAALGLDAALAALFLALLVPLLRDAPRRRAAAAGAVVAIVAVPLTPPGVPVVAAALGVLAGLPGGRAEARAGDAEATG